MSVTDLAEDDFSLLAELFEAGREQQLPSETVMDVLLDALQTGRSIQEIVADPHVLSRRQRETVRRYLETRPGSDILSGSTLKGGGSCVTPCNPVRRPPASADAFAEECQRLLPTGADRYEGQDEIGRGGWGVVVRAHDRQLDRSVAIKQLTEDGRAGTDVARRFLHEAKVTARLQHPGVVPVYERGIGPVDQQPFYAMKLLDGVTLREVIRNYHDAPAGRERRQLFHRLLQSLVDVCQAIAYAHHEGIIHRDLKPSNVIVGEFGETVVVDWGLARDLTEQPVDEPGSEATVAAGTPQPASVPSTVGGVRDLLGPAETQQGSVIGTPAYMSPEQARGDADRVDTRSDIYALGVILYVMLTGRPPFHGKDVTTTLRLVAEGEFRHPREIDRRVPAALASICTKAMARERRDRYQSAEDLAADLTAWLTSEPVSAHQDTLMERVVRWCRRRPALASTTIVGTTVLAVASTVAGLVVNNARHAEATARRQAVVAHAAEADSRKKAEESRAQALQHLQESRQAADTWLIDLSGTLERYPGLDPIRQDLLRQAEAHYEQMIQQAADDPLLQLEAVRSRYRLADLRRLSGETDQAAELFRQGLNILRTLRGVPEGTQATETLNGMIGRVLCSNSSGAVLRAEADSVLEQLQNTPNTSDNSRARAWLTVARIYRDSGDSDTALDLLTQAQTAARDFATRSPGTRASHLLSTIREELGQVYLSCRDYHQAARVFRDQVDAVSAQLSRSDRRTDLLETRAIASMQWAGAQRQLGEDWAAEGAYRSAVDDLSTSWKLLYGDHFYSENLAIAQTNLGQLAVGLRRLDDAELMLSQAADQLTGLLQSGQADQETVSRLISCQVSLGYVMTLRGTDGAEAQILHSLELYDYLEQEAAVSIADRLTRSHALRSLARCRRLKSGQASAQPVLEQSVRLLQALGDQFPQEMDGRLLPAAQLELAQVLREQQLSTEADELTQLAVRHLGQLADRESVGQKYHPESATVQLLTFLLDTDSIDDHGDAAERLRQLRISSSSPAHVHQLLAISAWRQGQLAMAEQSVRRAISMRRFPDAVDQAILGCILATCGSLTESDQVRQRLTAAWQRTPGDRRLQDWVAKFDRFTQPAPSSPPSPDSAEAEYQRTLNHADSD